MENAFRQQVKELLKRDPVLQRISAGFFVSSISTKNTHFHNFCKLIVCQQISGKAGDTIFHRLCKYLRVEQIKPANLSNESIESLKSLGFQHSKLDIYSVCSLPVQ